MEKFGVTLFLDEFGESIAAGMRRHARKRNHGSVQSFATKKRRQVCR
jgi:hypothetical protein